MPGWDGRFAWWNALGYWQGTTGNGGNPYDDLFWVGGYIYHLDQATAYGESMNWTGVVIGKGRWFCIEQYLKMNSITAPYDSVDSGVAVKDGQYRVWLDRYHGGTAPAPRDMHFRMDAVVIARSFIGPRNEGL
jgi:hypothetical protein